MSTFHTVNKHISFYYLQQRRLQKDPIWELLIWFEMQQKRIKLFWISFAVLASLGQHWTRLSLIDSNILISGKPLHTYIHTYIHTYYPEGTCDWSLSLTSEIFNLQRTIAEYTRLSFPFRVLISFKIGSGLKSKRMRKDIVDIYCK